MVFFSNDVDFKVPINPLFYDFGSNNIDFLLFSGLNNSNRLCTEYIHYIPDLFLFKYNLCEIGLLRPILETTELLSFSFMIIVFISHYDNVEE